MAFILGLDCSSATIGWALLESNNNTLKLDAHGNIKPPKKDGYHICERLDVVSTEIQKLCDMLKPDFIVIEDIVQFMKGKSSANTIITLGVFNRVCALSVYRTTEKLPIFLLPISIRARIRKFLGLKEIEKEDIPDLLQDYFGKKMFNITYKLRGKYKGEPVKEVYDEADAVAAAWAGAIDLELVKTNTAML
jgi:hypothetical protein